MRSLSRIFRKQVNRIRRVGFVIVNLLDIRRVLGAFFFGEGGGGKEGGKEEGGGQLLFLRYGTIQHGSIFFTVRDMHVHGGGCMFPSQWVFMTGNRRILF